MRIILVLGAMVLAALAILACYTVWPPDVISKAHRVVGEQTLAGDQRMRVIQFWNGVDFYSTQLEVVTPSGKRIFVLDGDDRKRWDCSFVETGGQIKVVVGGVNDGLYDLARGVLVRADGRLSEPLATNE